ncbi:TPA: hypothetical protein N0F65_009024 [Lagenidium giganteum]|uniref:Uncharacterized protein n=1 Tax=Lagenidium giganteum TaxID=4803 RepID=A0AAV2YWU5_9STRA|nr:TPA: hypothetical protein N0F65_009024 [Lagenidium giganteum]
MSALIELDLSDSDDEQERRPKLCTRRAIHYSEPSSEEDEMAAAPSPEQLEDTAVDESTGPRTRRRRKKVEDEDFELDEEAAAREEADDDAEDQEDDESSTDGQSEESDRRRSSRTRTAVEHFGRKATEEEEEEALKPVAQKQQRKQRRTSSDAQKRKKKKASAPRARRRGNDSEDNVAAESSASDSESDSGSSADKNDDDDDENAFVIDKILAREVHTRKEWDKLCRGRTTRFLTNSSIFLSDDEDEEEAKQDASSKTQSAPAASDKPQEPAAASSSQTASTTPKDNLGILQNSGGMDPDEETTTAAAKPATPPKAPKPSLAEREKEEEERFLIKWKKLSYIHVSWETEKALVEYEKHARGKIQRFREKEMYGLFTESIHGDEYFNPEFRIVDRVLDIQDRPGDDFCPVEDDDEATRDLKFILIKWKALSYDHITWEREDDVRDDEAVKAYHERLKGALIRYQRTMLSSGKSTSSKKRRIDFRGYTSANPPPFKSEQSFELRDYQLTGVNWMLLNWYHGRNSMLADEMGLGKTVQTVSFLNHLAVVENLPGPYLIVAPLSTLAHWQREFNSWTNLNAIVYHGTQNARGVIQNFEFFLSQDELSREAELTGKRTKTKSRYEQPFYRFDVLITTPEMCCAADCSKIARIHWQVMVVDEAHRLKNRNSKLSTAMHKSFSYENVLLLTGTPLQNNVEELWTLLNFLDGEKFDSMEEFLENYGDLKDSTQVERLHSELKPFLLRRMKEDVEKSLAPKEETIIEVELTVLQKQYYRAIYERNTEFLARGGKKANAPSLMNVVMELRKCCNHPFLIKGMEQREVERLRQSPGSEEEINTQIRELLVTTSGKLVLLDKLLPPLRENGHRVLIFSQFKIMLDILQDYLRLRNYRCERIDGNITGNERQAAIDRFCANDSQAFVMLLSTRAGGVGINLTAADTVIIYDSDWNPQNDLQAQARCHRIGQKKSVKIYRLLTSKTYELHMFHQASMKLGLDQAVLGGIRNQAPPLLAGSSKKPSAKSAMSSDEIESLLKYGAYEMFREEKEGEAEAASKKFSEESIDQILSRSTKIVHDPKKQTDGKKRLMSSFSKATFVSSTNPDEAVSIDDPDFWTKVVGLNGVDDKPSEPSPLKKRRCRRKVKSYLQDDSGDESRVFKRRKGLPKEKDNDEFVLSGESSSSDDGDTDELVDDDFEAARSKKGRSLRAIYAYSEILADALATFGYGRWTEIQRQYPGLKAYPTQDVKKLGQEYLASCARTAATSYINAKLNPSDPLIAGIAASTGQPTPAPMTYQQALDSYVQRFRVLSAVLIDWGAKSMTEIPIPPPLKKPIGSVKAEREANTRLLQIERVHQLNCIVQANFLPWAATMTVVRRLQHTRDRDHVRSLLITQTLPAEPKQQNLPVPKEQNLPQPKRQADKDKGPAGTHNAESTSASGVSTNEPSSKDDVQQPNGEASTTATTPMTEPPSMDDASQPNEVSKSADSASATVEGASGPAKASAAVPPQTSGDSKDLANNGTASAHSSPTKRALFNSNAQALSDSDLRKALKTLLYMPDPDNPHTVAPWWISLVDDVALLHHVYYHGWPKMMRILPVSMTASADLFGDRAVSTPITQWPTCAAIIRRLKVIVSVWSNSRKMASQASYVERTYLRKPSPVTRPEVPSRSPSPAENVPAVAATCRNVYHPTTAAGPPTAHQPSTLLPSFAQPRVTSSLIVAKQNRFAQLIFAYGIPDARAYSSEAERAEKWRYFVEDRLLQLSLFSLDLLHREAQDLERYCRLRAQMPGVEAIVDPTPSARNSILGGERGRWELTLTQCRRLVNRIDMFRRLRTQVLVLPPIKLVEVIGHVVGAMRSEPGNSDFPTWWKSPRHDILLIQGIECYGMDDYLKYVWRLPLFATTTGVTLFPSTTWVENHVTTVLARVTTVLKKARLRQLEKQREAERAATIAKPRVSGMEETMQRIRDIQCMRQEDFLFNAGVRARRERDIAEVETRRRVKEHLGRSTLLPRQSQPSRRFGKLVMALQEIRTMQEEDPQFSDRARAIADHFRREDARATADKLQQQTTTNLTETADSTSKEEEDTTATETTDSGTAGVEDNDAAGVEDNGETEAAESPHPESNGESDAVNAVPEADGEATSTEKPKETSSEAGDNAAAPSSTAPKAEEAAEPSIENADDEPEAALEEVVEVDDAESAEDGDGVDDSTDEAVEVIEPTPERRATRRQTKSAQLSEAESESPSKSAAPTAPTTRSRRQASIVSAFRTAAALVNTTATKRKREAPRPSEVIVIDDSDSSTEEEMITTRSKRRR